MHPILKNMLAVIVGTLCGGTVNGLLILNSASIIAPPEGADLTTAEGLTAAMSMMEPRHFLIPFLAHALGTLIGACAKNRLLRLCFDFMKKGMQAKSFFDQPFP